MKFPFFKYKTDNWDIEHVRSQTAKEISGSNRVDWSIDVLSYFTGINGYSDTIISTNKSEKIMQKEHVDKMPDIEDDKTKDFCVRLIEILDSEKIDDEKFKKLYEELLSYFKEGSTPEDIDNISNLALLDAATNRSYKNAMFPIKRKTNNPK